MKCFHVSGVTGQAGGLIFHRFNVPAPNRSSAKRSISRSTLQFVFDGERIRALGAYEVGSCNCNADGSVRKRPRLPKICDDVYYGEPLPDELPE